MSAHIQDVYDGTLGVDDESHDDDVQVRDDALPVLDDDGDAPVLDGDDGEVQELVRDDGEVQEQAHDDAVLVLVHDDALLVHDEQDEVRALLLQVLPDDVHLHVQVLPHDCHHLCLLVLLTHVHHDYCVQALMCAVELHHRYVSAVRKSHLT